MSGEFEAVRRSAAGSWLGRLATGGLRSIAAAWRSSLVGESVRAHHAGWTRLPIADRLRWVGRTVAIAAVAHLALRSMLSSTIAPALPALLIAGVAVLAAFVAWQADAFERAWRER